MGELFEPDMKPESYYDLRYEPDRIRCLSNISGATAGIIAANLGYQLQYSVQQLEKQLVEEGTPHILQPNLDWAYNDWRDPTYWWFFADGSLLSCGSGEYARDILARDPTGFQQLCRNAIADKELSPLDDRTYMILNLARSIAAHEPFGAGWERYGERQNRVF